MSKPPKLRPDVAETAYRVMMEATGQAPKTDPTKRTKNLVAVARGAKGGKVGGKARAKKLDPARRSEIAKAAAKSRWHRDG